MTASLLAFAACGDDDSDTPGNGGSQARPDKKLSKITEVSIAENLTEGTVIERDENEEIFIWEGNRLTGMMNPDDTATVHYGDDGHISLITVIDFEHNSRTCTPEYDGQGRVSKSTQRSNYGGDIATYTYTNTYDAQGNLVQQETSNSYGDHCTHTLTWENGDVVKYVEKCNYDDPYESTDTYETKFNPYACLPMEFVLTWADFEFEVLSLHHIRSNGWTWTYSGDYPVKRESVRQYTDEDGITTQYTEIQYFEYTDGTGRR